VNISGTNYLFDPSFKAYTYKTGINLGSALGYSQSTFLTQAESGATITADSVTNLNRTNIRSQLSTYASNLTSYIQSNLPDAGVDDVLGGRTIDLNVNPIRQTTLSYEAPGDTPVIWTGDVPNSYRPTLRVQFGGIDQTFYSDAIHHQRLTITFNGSNQPLLNLNGSVIATGSALTLGQTYGATYTAVFAAQNNFTLAGTAGLLFATGATYLVAFGWGAASRSAVDYHKNLLDQNRAAGTGDASEPVLGESLAVQWFTYWAIESRDHDLIGRIQGAIPVEYIFGGNVGWDATVPYFDLQVGASFQCSTSSNTDDPKAMQAGGITGGGTEGKTIRNQYGVGDLNTNRVIDSATLNSITIYDATSANWASTVKPNLTNYPTNDLNFIETSWINQGWRVLLPQNGAVPVDTVTDWGAFAGPSTASSFGSYIGKILGGLPTGPLNPGPIDDNNKGRGPNVPSPGAPEDPGAKGDEPTGLYQGNYLYSRIDFSVGSGKFPYSLSFRRNYDSSRRFIDSPLGLGWSHNFNIGANGNSDAFMTLGDAAALFAVPSIVAMYVINDLSTTPYTEAAANMLITALVERWMTELVTNNTVVVSFPESTDIFVVLAGGGYASIFDSGALLTLNAGAYTFTTKTGQALVFNTAGQISSWTWPNGVQLTFTYASGLLQSVTNGLTRTLSFTNSRTHISQVSDGARTVSYNVDGNKNLTSCTDTLSHAISYSYDVPGRMTQFFLPQNPTSAMVTNVYDSLGRVKTQNDPLNNQWSYFFAGSRGEEDDPNGGKRIFYFDRFGNVLRAINQVGQETDSVYDIFRRRSQMTMPEGNGFQYAYDSKSNVLSVTRIAKPGSGLTNIVNSFTYDSTWNKAHTAVDGRGNTTTYNYDPTSGNLLNIQRPQVGGQTPQVSFTYNSRGQVLTRTDETGIVTQFN
ncbi:MAG: DUF6531 domain-containing protein, partial [Terriglobales bacterium]